MFSSSSLSFIKKRTSNSSSAWSIKNWLVGSKGLTSLIAELQSSASPGKNSTPSSSSVQKIVNRYRKLLVHSSSWELLSPQQILTCLGATSIPLYSVVKKSSSSSRTNNNNINDLDENEDDNATVTENNNNSSSSASFANVMMMMQSSPELRVVETEFAEKVWSAALPSLAAFSVTMTSTEAASVVRAAHRLSVSLPPSLLRVCAERFSEKFIAKLHCGGSHAALLVECADERDAQIFEIFVVATATAKTTDGKFGDQEATRDDDEKEEIRKVKDAIVLMIRTAHAFSAQSSLLRQQQSRHDKLSQNSVMLSMIQNAVDERNNNNNSNNNNNNNNNSNNKNDNQKSNKSTTSKNRSFPSKLYSNSAIDETIKFCSQATMNLIETSCAIISSRETEEKVFRGRENDRSLFLERRSSLLSLFSFSSLCISIEALSLVVVVKTTPSPQEGEVAGRRNQTCFVLTQELIRRIQGASVSTEKYRKKNQNAEMSLLVSEEDGEPVTLQKIRDSFALIKCICEITSASEMVMNDNAKFGTSLANDLYVALTHKLGSFVRRLAFAGPEFYEEFVNAAIEMEKAAHVLQTFQTYHQQQQQQQSNAEETNDDHRSKDNATNKKKNLNTSHQHSSSQQNSSTTTSTTFDSIFKGERHSLDGPLVVESVANYFDHILQLFENHKNRRDNVNQLHALFLRNFKDVNQYSLLSSVAPLCIGSLVVWSDVEDVRTPAIRLLSKSLRYVSPTHLVRICQLIPRLRSSEFLAASSSSTAISTTATTTTTTNKVDNNEKKINAAADEKETTTNSVFAALNESEYASFIDELLAAVYVSYKDLSCVGCCVALRSLAELSVVEKERLAVGGCNNGFENENNKASSSSPYVLPIGALSLCVQALTARVSELLEIDARKKSSTTTTTASSPSNHDGNHEHDDDDDDVALSFEKRLGEADSVVVRYGYQTKLILEHIGVSLSMLGMLPGLSSTSNSSSSPSSSTTSSDDHHQNNINLPTSAPSNHNNDNSKKNGAWASSSSSMIKKMTFRDTIRMMENVVDFEAISLGAVQVQKQRNDDEDEFKTCSDPMITIWQMQ